MNNYFQFKQFTIQQDKCAMKVCTDSCLFGAWVAEKLAQKKIIANKIMDIGCGTGLLSLMLAQKTTAAIDAVELNEDAFLQATKNIEESVYKSQIQTFRTAIEKFVPHQKYDFIICNPPFYEKQLRSPKANKNAAMHETNLSFESVVVAINTNLSTKGKAAILLPFKRINDFKMIAKQYNFCINERLNIQHSPTHAYSRSIILISTISSLLIEQTISIRDTNGNYSKKFIDLLSSYYLHL